jgi:hypothetical protein
MAQVAGYIRRSHDGEAPVSKEVQEQTVLRRAPPLLLPSFGLRQPIPANA